MKHLKYAALALSACLCAVAGSAQAASSLGFSGLSGAEYDTAGVYVLGDITGTGTVDDGGGFDQIEFKLWDDSVVKFDQVYSIAVGTTQTFHFSTYYPGLVGTSAPGVGLYLYDTPDTSTATYIDPYYVPHYSDPSACTKDCGPISASVPEPSSYGMALMGLLALGFVMRRKA